MFVSTEFLCNNYGIDAAIAKFFVDREPPTENLYWKGRLLYLRPAPGYLFIPLIIDLLYRLGIDKQQLLSEQFVSVMEQIGHISALEETKQITSAEAIKQCSALAKHQCVNKQWLEQVVAYFGNVPDNLFSKLASHFRALHRGDVFLFSICMLTFSDELITPVARQWFALITSLLLLDDADDLQSDMKAGEENAYIESGLDAAGIGRINELFAANFETISQLNRTMARQFETSYTSMSQLPHISELLK